MNYTCPQNMQVGGMHTFVYYVPCTVFVTFSVPNKYVSLRCPRNAYGPAGADTSGAANHKYSLIYCVSMQKDVY